MNRQVQALAASVLLLSTPGLLAQKIDEAKFNQQQAKLLNTLAKKAFKKGFPRQAKIIWLQAIKLYEPDSPDAHAGLGHVKMGTTWAPKPGFSYPVADTGSSKAGGDLYKEYERVKAKLAANHRRAAQAWAKAERTDKKLYHYKMVLRWVKSDREAQAALEHREIGTLSGTSLEQTLYERSKKIEQAVTDQSRKTYASKKVTGVKQPILDRANVEYITVQSEHFTLHGDSDQEEALLEALVHAERTLRVMQVAFPSDTWNVPLDRFKLEWAYFTAKDTYKQILRANANQVSDLEWKLEHTSTSGLGNIVVGATGSKRVLHDACVRNVARVYSGFRTTGLGEGIGHTFVGMMFNNNRLFSVDLKKQQGTVASEEDRQYQSPDFDVWKDLNLELAWKRTGTVPARKIPFVDAASFSNEERIKAWSFCDYVMRRDPKILRDMDRLALQLRRGGTRTSPLAYSRKYAEKADVSIEQLDKEWEDFWTGASPVMKAIRNDTPPLAAVSRGAEKWLKAFNKARKDLGKVPVTWSANLSKRCREHAIYLANNKDLRDAASVHTQEPTLGGTHIGAMFAEMAVVETRAKLSGAQKMFKKWLDIPGYRDALVNNYILSVGLYTEGPILVMNVVSSLGEPRSKSARGFHCYPRDGMRGIPSTVKVADLGPEVVKLLEKHGEAKRKELGYPLTMHFGIGVQGNRQSYRCTIVDSRNNRIPGIILHDNGNIRRTTAPGMVTCYPLKPLKGQITTVWSWEQGGQSMRLQASFLSR